MKFKLDENLGFRCKRILEEAGNDAHSVFEEGLSGSTDQTLYEVCIQERRCLITLDLDFADVTRYPPHHTAGIVVLRLPKNPSLDLLEKVTASLLTAMAVESIEKRLWIVEPGRIRVHEDTDQS